jgi:hypothetical protein
MALAMKTMNVWEQKYHELTALYALADELLATVPHAADPQAQLDLVEPLVETIGSATDTLTEEYINYCDGKKSAASKTRVEGALRKIYRGLGQCKASVRDARNTALAVLNSIKRQLEQVVVNFLEFVAVSLDRIMQKQEIEEIKQRHAHLAMMLHHQQQLGPQGA